MLRLDGTDIFGRVSTKYMYLFSKQDVSGESINKSLFLNPHDLTTIKLFDYDVK